jgi:hypothetical protein
MAKAAGEGKLQIVNCLEAKTSRRAYSFMLASADLLTVELLAGLLAAA